MKGVTIVIHETILVEVNVQAVLSKQTLSLTTLIVVVTDQVSNGGVITFVIPFEKA